MNNLLEIFTVSCRTCNGYTAGYVVEHTPESMAEIGRAALDAARNGRKIGVTCSEVKLGCRCRKMSKTERETTALASTRKLFRHAMTGLLVWPETTPERFENKPEHYTPVPTMYEDELPEDMSDEQYQWWFENSIVDGVRIGPRITRGEKA